MYRLERQDFVQTQYISLWSILGFQAGFINAFGFLAFGKYVSHVTGFGTQIGVALAEKMPWFAFELVGFPLSFIAGAFFSGIITGAKIENGLKPRYDIIMMLIPFMLITLSMLGYSGVFGTFGEQLISQKDFILLFILSFICGMQNACFATMTKGQIRTTHLTGISTDIGTDFARLLLGKLSDEERMLTRKTNYSRIATFLAFASGSILSVLTSNQLDFFALLVPATTSLFIFIAVRKIGRILDRRFKPSSEPLVATVTSGNHQLTHV